MLQSERLSIDSFSNFIGREIELKNIIEVLSCEKLLLTYSI